MILLLEIFNESTASDEAKKRGLISKGWGYWANSSGEIVARTVDGKLEYIFDKETDPDHPQHRPSGRSGRAGKAPDSHLQQNYGLALNFALRAHGDQMYGDKPYKYHLLKVFQLAQGGTTASRQAALLHDVLEDTSVTKEQLEKQFGPKVAHIVDLVTKRPNEPNASYYDRINTDREAVFVKLCDRLANATEGEKNDKYAADYPLFKQKLHIKGEYQTYWWRLDKLLANKG